LNNPPLTYTAGAEDTNIFLRDLLAAKLLLSHSLLVRLKHQNKIQVNGQFVHTDYRIQAGDFVPVNIDLSEENKIILTRPLPKPRLRKSWTGLKPYGVLNIR
jgi:23S rRNA pseudouridine1911/1915/1917 synthase